MSWIITGTQKLDPDAASYIDRVEAADGQSLEEGVKLAYSTFVSGCKTDGIWNAIKACCILAGARTTNGSLIPLVGTAPTPFNFDLVNNTDYNRKTGLAGNGSTKYLDSNRTGIADPQDSHHTAIYASTIGTPNKVFLSDLFGAGGTELVNFSNILRTRVRNSSGTVDHSQPLTAGFLGASRSNAANYIVQNDGTSEVATASSATPTNLNKLIFVRQGLVSHSDARLAFYSIGESLDLALLDTRVTTLMSDLAAAIP